ncbi:hypothetical protein Dda_8858 [Drechslerella dactyloides]|uniref:Uncharacterized protein n=1 Tax=Drechslerella dactyloides TaxID=74499 RepID=A0AAD6NFI8_DREDA|nr:hypothetical protein Dda_8858 [Drechslerella dactyloides]
MTTSVPPPNTHALRHRKASSELSNSATEVLPTDGGTVSATDNYPVPLMETANRHVQVTATALSLTSLLTTLTTSEGITTTARKLYAYPTKRLSTSELWRRYKSDEDIDGGRGGGCPSTSSSGSSTPPPDYDEDTRITTISPPPARVFMPIASTATNVALPPEDAGLVSAKFAMQGHNLLSLSLAEPASSTFRRHLYVDSLTYLLRALPADLSTSEATQLIASLPPSLQSYFQMQRDMSAAVGSDGMQGMNVHLPSRQPEHPTIHYVLAVVTAATVASVRHLAPHVKTLARSTWEYNVKYRVAERGIDAVRGAVDSGFAFWKTVAQWVMMDDEETEGAGEKGTVARRRRYGARILGDVGRYAGGVVRSGVGGVVEGFVEGMRG